MTEKLSPNFLNELFRSAFRNKNIFEVLQQYLEYHYLPTKEYKEIWKTAKTHYEIFNELPTIGIIAETHKVHANILQQLNLVKDADIISQDVLLSQIESYLKDVKFLDLYDTLWELREQGKKNEALKELEKRTEEIANFSLRAQQFESVFRGFEPRYNNRAIENATKGNELDDYCVFGIDALDARTRGCPKKKTCLITARSGVGKSKMLKWIAYSNARMGKRMLHFQLEGSKEECLLAYEAMITGSPYYDLKTTTVEDQRLKKAIEGSNKITGDIHVIAYERFGSATMTDIRNSIIEYIKQYGDPDGIVVDYLDEAQPGDGKKYSPNVEGEKARKRAIAGLFTNLCIEFNMAGFIPTQASDVDIKIWNNPKETMTRSNIKGDRNLVDPFSFHFTLNQTLDEKKNHTMRIFEDKYRDHPSGMTHHIATAYQYEKFYDRPRTLNLFGKK